MKTQGSQIKSRKRVADHGEVFTPDWLVSDMCDLVASECERIESRFLEPACGEGAFLAEVLRRKLKSAAAKYAGPLLHTDYERGAIQCLMSIYGVELLPDNAAICRKRLFDIWQDAYASHCGSQPDAELCGLAHFILATNILCGDALSMQTDSGEPIIFAEWSFIGQTMVKRRDFRLDTLLKANEKAQAGQIPLGVAGVGYDEKKREYVPLPLREFAPIHYRKLAQAAFSGY